MKQELIEKLVPHELCLIFPEMTADEFHKLKNDISGSGQLEPIVVWQNQILDGRHRYRACIELGIHPWIKQYDGPDSPADYVISVNLRRRHLTPNQQAAAYAAYCNYQPGGTGGNRYGSAEENSRNRPMDPSVDSNVITIADAAKKSGVSEKTMKRTNKVVKEGAPELTQAIVSGDINPRPAAELVEELPDHEDQKEVIRQVKEEKIPIKEAVKQVKKTKLKGYFTLSDWKQEKRNLHVENTGKTLNKQSDNSEDSMGNIEWAKWSWNPVTGCKHDCSYCYARDIAERFYEQGFEPSFWPERLHMPGNTKVPNTENPADRNIFSNSMSDLYGRWVPNEWINAVLDVMRSNPKWNFLTLTKFPKKAAEFTYANNIWIGASVDLQARVKATEESFVSIECGKRWLSLEPLIEPLRFNNPELFDWVVIGGASKSNKTPAWTPPAYMLIKTIAQFIEHDCKIYLKTNGRPKEFPGVVSQDNADDVFYYLRSK